MTTENTKPSMDTSKVVAALQGAKNEVQKVIEAEIKARSFGGLKGLTNVDAAIDDAIEKLDRAAKRATPRAKRERKSKSKDKKAA